MSWWLQVYNVPGLSPAGTSLLYLSPYFLSALYWILSNEGKSLPKKRNYIFMSSVAEYKVLKGRLSWDLLTVKKYRIMATCCFIFAKVLQYLYIYMSIGHCTSRFVVSHWILIIYVLHDFILVAVTFITFGINKSNCICAFTSDMYILIILITITVLHLLTLWFLKYSKNV